MFRGIFIVFVNFLFSCLLFRQLTTDSTFLRIEENIYNQLTIYPQEKIHLHTDRDYYAPGEKLWFKAYLTDAVTHLFPTDSRYVYVELIDSRDSLVNRVMIRPENGMFYGHLQIAAGIQEGNYTLRAYTRYMENVGDDYFFKKNIRISPSPSLPNREGERGAAGRNAEQKHYTPLLGELEGASFDVSFFPEGGNLVEGAFCKVAIKALSRTGYAETISGILVDETGVEITMIQTEYAGMGAFTFIPMAGKRYLLKCQNNDGIEKQFELPQADPHAQALTVIQRNKMITIGVHRPADSPDMPCYLLGHCRGMVFYFSAFGSINDFITFPEESLPAGVLQFVLFDEQMNPLSERLVFSKNYDKATVEFQTDKEVYEKREKVVTTLSFSDSPFGVALSPFGGGVGGGLEDYNIAPALYESADSLIPRRSETLRQTLSHLSVAITDDKDYSIDESATILSTLLLSSELKGYIENPAYYLMDNQESAIALDYLMLTHGWRRYNIPEAVKGNYETPQIPFQTSQQISGKVKSMALSRPVADSDVYIKVNNDFEITNTDKNGKFSFRDFEYSDSTTYFIQALSRSGSNNVEIDIEGELFPGLIYAPQSILSRVETKNTLSKDEISISALIEKAEQRSNYDNDIRVMQLGEVEVTAPRIERKDESRLQFWANSNSDITIRREEIEKTSPRFVSDWLRNIPGVKISSTGFIVIRGEGSFSRIVLPLVIIDGIPMDWPEGMASPYESPLETVSVHDVESIDIFKGSEAAAFGSRAAGGVISITTRRGIDVMREVEKFRENKATNFTVFTPLGYQRPEEFYSPKYETLEAKYQSIPDSRTTIFWKPDIVISEEGKASFEFYTSDFTTTYSVVIEGLTADGRIIRQVEKIVVN